MNSREVQIAAPGWGIAFRRPALESGGLPLRTMPPPDKLIVALQQNVGIRPEPLVAVGDTVLTGQPIGAAPDQVVSAQIHAPTSGRITAIQTHRVPGRDALCIHIEADHRDLPWLGYSPPIDPLQAGREELLEAVTAAGIVGLGGAMFPTSHKLTTHSEIDTLILNGVECEPKINCDDALIRHRAKQILLGAQIMLRILAARQCFIAVKADTAAAISQLRTALDELDDDRFRLALIPPLYPAGGEAQLIQMLTGQEIPTGGLPRDTGVICQNVATAASLAHFLTSGEPLISRIVTVTGSGVASPLNVEARIGTPLRLLIDFAGGYTTDQAQLIMGGPMMGVALAGDDIPLTKAANCIYVRDSRKRQVPATEMPCIRCGDCATVCPAALTPQLMLSAQRTNDFEYLQQLGLNDCIECGCCDYVCPSNIGLTQQFVSAKQSERSIQAEQKRAQLAEARYTARNERLTQRANERDQELTSETGSTGSVESDSKQALQRLLDRVSSDKQNRE